MFKVTGKLMKPDEVAPASVGFHLVESGLQASWPPPSPVWR
jgi:hypothetical protein